MHNLIQASIGTKFVSQWSKMRCVICPLGCPHCGGGSGGKEEVNISKGYYMGPERPVHQTLRTLRTLTVTLDATSAGRHVQTPLPIYPWVLDIPTTSTIQCMRPDALRP